MTKPYVILFNIENLKENRKKCALNTHFRFKDLRSARAFARYHEDALIYRISKNNRLYPLLTEREMAENAENRRIWKEVFEYCTI